VIHEEKISAERLDVPKRIEKFTLCGVKKVICGGILDSSLDQLRNMGIEVFNEVFNNVIGDALVALGTLFKGKIKPRSNCEKKDKFYPWQEVEAKEHLKHHLNDGKIKDGEVHLNRVKLNTPSKGKEKRNEFCDKKRKESAK